MLFSSGLKPEASTAVELADHAGWSVDAIATATRLGGGIARDLVKRGSTEIDLGIYGTTRLDRWDPRLGLGLSINW